MPEYEDLHDACTPVFLDEHTAALILGETPGHRAAAERARRRAEIQARQRRQAEAAHQRQLALMTKQDWAALSEWDERGVNLDVWRLAGLGRFDARIAEQCELYGLTPEMVGNGWLDGRRICELLRSGETAASVYARLHEAG